MANEWQPPPERNVAPPPVPRSAASTAGLVFVVIFALMGLVFVGFIVFMLIAFSSYGSNK